MRASVSVPSGTRVGVSTWRRIRKPLAVSRTFVQSWAVGGRAPPPCGAMGGRSRSWTKPPRSWTEG